MKKRVLFLVWYRGGSTLFECLLGKPWRITQMRLRLEEAGRRWNEWRNSGKPFFLPTIPLGLCPSEDISCPLDHDPFGEYGSWVVHVGDWWGDIPGASVPEPYSLAADSRWGPDELMKLGSQWTVIFLVRNGIYQISSLWNLKGGWEEKRKLADPDDYFLFLCRGFRNRARMALDGARLPNVCLFKAEDLFADPIAQMERIFSAAGLVLDSTVCSSFLDEIRGLREGWSSRAGDDNLWTPVRKKLFLETAGTELFELGYQAW